MDLNDRNFLIELRDKAREEALVQGLNQAWKRAYERLADAADDLDAKRARCQHKED